MCRKSICGTVPCRTGSKEDALSDIVVGLDIGTSSERTVIGEFSEYGTLQITGVGTSPSTGLRKGVVVNIEATLRAISSAVESAEMMSGREVESCVTAVGGSQIEGLNSRGVVAVTSRGKDSREISREDIDRVIEAARAVVIPMDRQVLHVIPQSYIVDDQKGVRDPRDMIGVRLEAEVHIVTCSVTSSQNVVKCVNRAGYRVDSLVLKTLAATRAVMTEEERELGSVLIDLGAGTTDILVLMDGAPLCTTSVPLGGIQVTNDISIVKGISMETSERIKVNAGCCWAPLIENYEEVIIPGVGGRPPEAIPRTEICRIVQPRMEEIFQLAKDRITHLTNIRPLSGNVVLTGGGALLPGVVELASDIFDTPAVRIGIPGNLGGLIEEYRSPEFSTAVGLVLCGAENRVIGGDVPAPKESRGKAPGFGKFVDWLKEFF